MWQAMIRKELNEFKSTEMDVHEESRQFTRLVMLYLTWILLTSSGKEILGTEHTQFLFNRPISGYSRFSQSPMVNFCELLWQYFLQVECPSCLATKSTDNMFLIFCHHAATMLHGWLGTLPWFCGRPFPPAFQQSIRAVMMTVFMAGDSG